MLFGNKREKEKIRQQIQLYVQEKQMLGNQEYLFKQHIENLQPGIHGLKRNSRVSLGVFDKIQPFSAAFTFSRARMQNDKPNAR